MRVLVCGGRDFGLPQKSIESSQERAFIWEYLARMDAYKQSIDVVIHGDAKGVDRCAGAWARHAKITERAYSADWKKYGVSAGPIRNQKMLDEGKPDLVIAFTRAAEGGVRRSEGARVGRGTADMVRRAKKAGVRVEEVNYKQSDQA